MIRIPEIKPDFWIALAICNSYSYSTYFCVGTSLKPEAEFRNQVRTPMQSNTATTISPQPTRALGEACRRRARRQGRIAYTFLLSFGLFATLESYAQDAIRPSIAGAEASIARMQHVQSQSSYNLKLGQFLFSLTGGLTTEYNDNINLSSTGATSDFILSANLSAQGEWKATNANTLRVGVNLGYSKYMDHPEFDSSSIAIGPDSQIAYDMYIGGMVKVTVQDRFGITQDPTEQASLSNVVNFRQFQNTATVMALVDLNKVLLTFGYDHYTALSLNNAFSTTDHNSDSLRVSGAYMVSKATTIGVDGAASYNYYEQNYQNDSTSFTFGPFVEQTFSRYLTLRASGGVQTMSFSQGGLNGDTSDLTGWYGGIELAHRVNRFWTQTLSVGHESSLALQANYETSNYARYTATLRVTNKVSVAFNAFYEQVDESGGIAFQKLGRFGGGASFGYQMNHHLSLSAGYQFINKTSNLPGYDYTQNRVFLGAAYKF